MYKHSPKELALDIAEFKNPRIKFFTGQSNQKTSKKKVKQTTLLLYERKKSNDFYIFWYRGFFIGFPLLCKFSIFLIIYLK